MQKAQNTRRSSGDEQHGLPPYCDRQQQFAVVSRLRPVRERPGLSEKLSSIDGRGQPPL
jgi:hypothetical protein